MNIDIDYTNPVRIIGQPGDTKSYMLNVSDAVTGEAINNVFAAILVLDVNKESTASLRFYRKNEKDELYQDDEGKVAIGEVTTKDPIVDVTAWRAED